MAAETGAKRKLSADSDIEVPSAKRQKTAGILETGEGKEVASTAQADSVEITHGIHEEGRLADIINETAEYQQPTDVDEPQQEDAVIEVEQQFSKPEVAKYLTAASFRVGEVVTIPVIRPFIGNDRHVEEIAEQTSNDPTMSEVMRNDTDTFDFGKFQMGFIQVVIAAIYTTNMVALPVLDGRFNGSGAARRQANLNMSLDLVADTSARKKSDHPEFSKTKLFLRDDSADGAWQPEEGAHVHFGKPLTVEYHWHPKVLNKLTTISADILIKRYDFVHGTLRKGALAQSQAKLIAYSTAENQEYCKLLNKDVDGAGDATPTAPLPENVDNDPSNMPRADPRAGTESVDIDDGVKEPPRNTNEPKPAKPDKTKKNSTLELTKTGNAIDNTSKKPSKKKDPKTIPRNASGSKRPKNPSDGTKRGKTVDDGDQDDEDHIEDEAESGSDSESRPDSGDENRQKHYRSGRGKTTRKVRVNGKIKYECSHDCEVKFTANLSCSHPCCRIGIGKRPVKGGEQLPLADDGNIPEFTLSDGKELTQQRSGVKGDTEDGEESEAQKSIIGVAQRTESKSKKTKQDNVDDFIDDSGQGGKAVKKGTRKGRTQSRTKKASPQHRSASQTRADLEEAGAESEDSDGFSSSKGTKDVHPKGGAKTSGTSKKKDTKAKAATTSRQGSTKASQAGGVSKASTGASGPMKNPSRTTSISAKLRSGSGSAAASTAAKKPAGTQPKSRSASSASAKASKDNSTKNLSSLDQDILRSRIEDDASGEDRQQFSKTKEQTKARKPSRTQSKDEKQQTHTDQGKKGDAKSDHKAEANRKDDDNQSKTQDEAEPAKPNGDKDQSKTVDEAVAESQDDGQNEDEDKGMPDEVEQLLAATNNQSQTVNRQVQVIEPAVEDEDAIWADMNAGLMEDELIAPLDHTTLAAPSVPNGFTAPPAAVYYDDRAYADEVLLEEGYQGFESERHAISHEREDDYGDYDDESEENW